jgi:hypothetical protein
MAFEFKPPRWFLYVWDPVNKRWDNSTNAMDYVDHIYRDAAIPAVLNAGTSTSGSARYVTVWDNFRREWFGMFTNNPNGGAMKVG